MHAPLPICDRRADPESLRRNTRTFVFARRAMAAGGDATNAAITGRMQMCGLVTAIHFAARAVDTQTDVL